MGVNLKRRESLVFACVFVVILLVLATQMWSRETKTYVTQLSFAAGVHPPNATFVTQAQPSAGCYENMRTLHAPGITLHCTEGVSMDAKFPLAVQREHVYTIMLRKNADCAEKELLGKAGDGGWYACHHEPFLFKSPCLVYSFGIRDDWSFDEAISQKYGCEVHSFDPSIGKEDHKHSDLIYFHNIGLGGKNEIITVKNTAWKMRTFCTLLRELGHTNRTVDYLKFDIESSEWATLVTMLDEGCLPQVKQLSFEGHAWADTPDNYTTYWRGLHGLENMGFQKWRLFNRNWRCFKPKDEPKKQRCPQTDMNFFNVHYMTRR